MENVFIAITFALFASMVLTFIGIVRDVLPTLSEVDQFWLRKGWLSRGYEFSFYGPGGKAWDQHIQLFPRSRKRMLFASLLIATALSVFGYPLWLVFATR